MKKKITLIPGDGIGPEVTAASKAVALKVASIFGHELIFEEALMGACAIDKTGDPLPDATLQKCKDSDAILFGAIGDPKYDNNPSAKVRPEQGLLKLRKELQLFANIRPILMFEELQALSPLKVELLKEVDFVIYRELTGGIYFGNKERNEQAQSAKDDCTYFVYEIERIAKLAFQRAQLRRKKLTLVDKANVLETSRLWRETVQKMHKDFNDVQLDFLFVDNAAMQIIINPKQFDVILTENLFGDILSDEASVLPGSLGLLPSASVGNGTALFEPIHGSYPQAAGKNIANPLASILSAAMMFEHFAWHAEAKCIEHAVRASIRAGVLTSDLDKIKGKTTSEVTQFVLESLAKQK